MIDFEGLQRDARTRDAAICDLRICPGCGRPVPPGNVLVGRRGAFCSLDCAASFCRPELEGTAERAGQPAPGTGRKG